MTQKQFIKEICAQENITIESLSHDYVFRLTRGNESRHIFGAFWDLNSAAADRIACDKCACYSILNKNGIPAIQHELINNPLLRQGWLGSLNTPTSGIWNQALAWFKTFNQKVVLKPNQGSMGQDVFLCDTIPSMEAAVQAIFSTQPNAAISPYHHIATEYRVFYVNGNCPFAYGKTPDFTKSWQHNLAQGAKASLIPAEKKQLTNALNTLASRAAKTIGINFATIDIAELASSELIIMEINAGVQARYLLEQHPQLKETIKKIYTEAIHAMFKPTLQV